MTEPESQELTKKGEKRKRRPGGGRKKSEHGAYKESQNFLTSHHPEATEIMWNVATGVASNIVCPKCKHKFSKKIGLGVDSDMLKHIDNRVMGKPKQVTELDITERIELTSAQLSKLSQKIQIFIEEAKAVPLQTIEAEFKLLPHPDVSDVRLQDKSDEVEIGTFREIPGAPDATGAEITPTFPKERYVEFTTPEEEPEE